MKSALSFSDNKNSKKHNTKQSKSIALLRLHYKFWILFGVLILAGIAIILRIETPVVWTFLYGIGGWAALTTTQRNTLL
jgi:hypothetical protein